MSRSENQSEGSGDLFDFGRPVEVRPVAGEARSMGEVLRLRARTTPDTPASFDRTAPGPEGTWQHHSWADFYRRSASVARGLVGAGVGKGDCLAILGPTSVAWAEWDLGGHLAGMVTVGVYPKQTPEQVRYLLEHSRARVVVAHEEELPTLLEAAEGLDSVKTLVAWDSESARTHAEKDPRLVSPEAFEGEPLDEAEIDRILDAVRGDDTAILVYTSGTTGAPKGAAISHENLLAMMRAVPEVLPFYENDLLISFLPLAHVTERNLSFYLRLSNGVAAAYASSLGAVLDEVKEARPTVFGSVPRLFEKAYAKIRSDVAKKPAAVQKLFAWAEGVGRERLPYLLSGEAPPVGLNLRYRLASALVLKKIPAAFGGRVRLCLTGAAPISLEILEFFWGAGLPIFEAFGMTEATVVTHMNRPGAVRLGTVGRIIPPMEGRIAEDGELLMRGPFVFQGYKDNPQATAETVVDDWLHTGDIGTLDDDGYLRITDRKKHLIITAGGKNVAPANIERAIKSRSPLISQVHAHGDRRPYVSALVAPSPLETLEWGVERGLVTGKELEERRRELMADPSSRSEALVEAMGRVVAEADFQALFLDPVRRGNEDLARVEKVRRFVVLPRDFSQEGGEMTPTMKMKRRAIETKFSDTFDRIYSDPSFGHEAEQASR